MRSVFFTKSNINIQNRWQMGIREGESQGAAGVSLRHDHWLYTCKEGALGGWLIITEGWRKVHM